MRWLYLAVPTGLIVAVLVLQALLMAVDPYSQYPWSPPRELPEEAQSGSLSPYLMNAARRLRYDTVLVGGSALRRFRPDDIVAILPGAGKPVNLSYSAPRPADLRVMLPLALEMPGVRRFIVSLDHTYMLPKVVAREDFPFTIYTNSIRDRFLVTDNMARELSYNLVTRGALRVDGMSYSDQRVAADAQYRSFRSPAEAVRVSRTIAQRRPFVTRAAHFDCRDLTSLNDVFVPFVKKASAMGKQVDIIYPAYSIAFYYFANDPAQSIHGGLQPTIDDHIVLRRCAIEALAGVPGVRIFAFDSDAKLVGDLGNYYDPGHLYQMEHYRYMLRQIAAGRSQLTLASFAGYAARLRRNVVDYSYYNTAIEGGRP